VTTTGLLFSRAAEIPADGLEDLRLEFSGDKGFRDAEFTARSDHITIRFGGRLSDKEAKWIESVLRQVLTA
jgi:hypothetical protein